MPRINPASSDATTPKYGCPLVMRTGPVSVNQFAVYHLVQAFQVRNVQGTHSFNGRREGFISTARSVRLSSMCSCRTQDAGVFGHYAIS